MSEGGVPPTSRLLDVLGEPIDRGIVKVLAGGDCTVKELEAALPTAGGGAILEHRRRLAGLGVIREQTRPGTERTKELALTEGLGRATLEVFNLADRCLDQWFAGPDWVDPPSLDLVAAAPLEGWRYEILPRTALRSRTVAGIERDAKSFTHNEINRRMKKLERVGLMERDGVTNRGPLYKPAERCRRLVGLLATIARLEVLYLERPDFTLSPGLVVSGVLFALPLLNLPADARGAIELTVKQRASQPGERPELARASLAVRDGRVVWRAPGSFPDAVAKVRSEASRNRSPWREVDEQDLRYERPTSWLLAEPMDCADALLDVDPKAIVPDGEDGGELVEMARADLALQLFPG